MAGASTDSIQKERKIRVLLAASVLEGHDRGIKYIAKRIVEDGMEVIYITYEQIQEVVDVAIQESANVIGISSSTGAHMAHMSDLVDALRVKEEDDMLLMVGGIIPTADMPALKAIGVKGIFGPGTLDEDVVNFIKENIWVQAQSA